MKQKVINLAILTLIGVLVIGMPVFAYIYRAPYTVISENTTDFEMLGVYTDNAINNQWMADNGFMSATARDTRIETLGGLDKPHMVTDDKTFAAIPVPAGSQTNLYFVTGESEQDFYVIPGYGGYVTVADNTTIELSANFTIEQSGWWDTSYDVGKYAVYKEDALFIYISDDEEISASIIGTGNVTQSYQVSHNDDDCRRYWTGAAWGFEKTTICSVGYWSAAEQKIGAAFRFNSVNLAQTQPIINAYITFNSSVNLANDDVNTRITGEDADNAATFVDLADLEARAHTTANITWDGIGAWVQNTEYTSPDIADIIREIKNRPGWVTGNSIVIFWEDWEGRSTAVDQTSRKAWGHDVDPAKAAILTINAVIPQVTATGVSSGEHIVTTNGTANYPAWATGDVLTFTGAGYARNATADWRNGDSAGSIMVWFKTSTDVANQTLFTSADEVANKHYISLYVGTNGQLYITQKNNDATDVVYTTGSIITDGEWHQGVVTSNGTIYALYIDGQPRGLVGGGGANTGDWFADTNNRDNVVFGALLRDALFWGLDGSLCFARVYSAKLTPTQIETMYDGDYTYTTNMVGEWYFDEGSGSVYDYGGGDYTLVPTNGTWETSTYTTGKTGRLCDFTIQVDDDRWGGNLKGASVPDNDNDWVFLQNNVMPYSDNISISVNGTLALWFRPNDIISGTTLPDRATSVANDGTFTFGANPENVSVTMGGLVSSSQPSPGVTVEDPTPDIMPGVEVTDWYIEPDVGGALLTNPMRPFVTMMSDTTTLTELQAWRILGTALVLMVLVGTAKAVRGHHFITGIATGAIILGMVVWTIYPMWALVFMVMAVIAGLISERTPSV